MDQDTKTAETIPAPPPVVEPTELDKKSIEALVLRLHLLKGVVEKLDKQKLDTLTIMRSIQEELKGYSVKFGPGVGVVFSPDTMSVSDLVRKSIAPPIAK